MIEIVPYTHSSREAWDEFVLKSKNGSFFFQRGYMEYHSDRFTDSSLLAYRNGELAAIFPASRREDIITSHGGLTFGGVISDERMTTPIMLEVFPALLATLRAQNARQLIYKPPPLFYHRLPAEEDLYAAFHNGARVIRRDIGSILMPGTCPAFQERRRRSIKKALKAGVEVSESADLAGFWAMLSSNLRKRHGTNPVHSHEEIQKLQAQFPMNIRLFIASLGGDMQAGTLIFENPEAAHTQYICTSPEGRDTGALDLVFSELITGWFAGKKWFSFGTSTSSDGSMLNAGLIEQKEGFGARACIQDSYQVDL